MKTSREVRSVRYGLLLALLALGAAELMALAIQKMSRLALSPASSENSFSPSVVTPELVARGRDLYAMSCSGCHGDDATGDEGPNLHLLPVSNAYIRVMIKKGLKGEMPTFKKTYNDEQITALIAFLRSLQ